MTTKVSTKVRLVRCPKCRQVLPELPEVPLYKCGGCGTILEAKNRRVETSHAELSSQEPDSLVKDQQDNVLEEKEEAASSNRDLSGPPEGESSPDKFNISCGGEHGDCSMEPCEDKGVSRGISSPPEVTSLQNEDSPREDKESLKSDNLLGQNSKRFHVKFHDDEGEWTRGRKLSSEFSSSGELTREAEVYNSEAGEHVEQEEQVDPMEGGKSKVAWQEEDNCIDEIQNLPKHEKQESILPAIIDKREGIKINNVQPENDEKSRVWFTDQNGDFDGGIKHGGQVSSSGIISHENNISKSTEQSMEVDDCTDGQLLISRSSSTERNMNASVSDFIVAPQSSLNESLVSLYLTSPDDECMDHSLRERTGDFERVSSVDTFGSSTVDDFSSEIHSKHPSLTNYVTVSHDAYDGSESSYDGTDDQIRGHISHPSIKNKDVYPTSNTEVLRKERLRVNNVVSSEPERNYWATSASHRATKSCNRSQDKSAETNRYTTGNRMRLDKQGAGSRLPFTSRDPLAGHRSVGISSYQRDWLPPRQGFNLSDKPSYSESDNMDLLRTVWELKDQLNRMQFSKVTTNRRFPAEVVNGKFTPFHYDHVAPEREIYADHPGRYNPRFNQAKHYAEPCNVSKLAYSGEAAHYRHHVSCSCLHCCPQDWQYSAQLPSCSVHRDNGHHVVRNGHNYCSVPSSLHYTSSELSSWDLETKSDNQRSDEIKRLPLKEKYLTAKRHVRPIAGGAPVIACYYCSEVLQLPVDFLLFKKRYHQLLCNACKKVLKFSLLNGTRMVPYLPDASAPPPSEVDDFHDAYSQRNLDPLSHSCSYQNAERVSSSEDYGPSFGRSCSTEGEASVILPSLDHAERNPYNRKMSSGSSFEPMEDRKMKSIMTEPQHKKVNSLKNIELVGHSSEMPKQRKATSEIEELSMLSNSPLHRLMGYSSPSQVLNK